MEVVSLRKTGYVIRPLAIIGLTKGEKCISYDVIRPLTIFELDMTENPSSLGMALILLLLLDGSENLFLKCHVIFILLTLDLLDVLCFVK